MAFGLPSDFRFDIHARDRSGAAWRGVQSNMERTQRAGSALLRTLGPLLGAAGGAIGASALADLARRSLEFSDALVAAADRTSFAVDELERLRFAGYQNRIEFGQTDMALQRFSRRIAEAAQGSGELRADLRQLGIQLRDENGVMRSSYDILLDFADAVASAESGNEQLRLAFKAFDSEGAAFVNVLREGREGLEAYSRQAEEAGAIMGDDLARNAAEANRRLREIQQSFQGQFNTAIAENADELVQLADALGQVAAAALSVVGAFGAMFREPIADTIAAAVEQASLSPIDEEIERLQAEIDAAAEIQSRGAIGRINEYQRQIRVLLAERGRLDALFSNKEERDQRAAQETARREAAERRAEEAENNNRRLTMPEDDWGAEVTPRYATRHDHQARLREELTQLLDEMEDVVSDVSVAQVEALKEQLEQNREDFSRTFAGAFADGAMAAFDGDLQEYLRRRLYQAAYNGLYDAFTEAGNYLFDIMARSKGGFGGLLGSAGRFLGFGGGKAGGGPAQPGLVYRVGERGPEDVVFGAPAHVMSAEQSMGRIIERERVVVVAVDRSEFFTTAVQEAAAPLAQAAEARAVARTASAAKQNAVRQSKRLKK